MKLNNFKSSILFRILVVILSAFLLQVAYTGYLVASTPSVIRKPKLEHYHFRMQILVNGKAENFSAQAYQKDYAKDQCSAALPQQPIHFHDAKDQFVHIHWQGITGGMVMKYYGWNYIGGTNNSLGYKFDKLTNIQKVPIHGNLLPEVPEGAKFYIYTGDKTSYQERSLNDWQANDLENFFGVKSNFLAQKVNNNLLNKLFPKAQAHGVVDDNHTEGAPESQEEKLTRINNLIGNVVIFVQPNKPSDQQVKDRFNALQPLSESTCGG